MEAGPSHGGRGRHGVRALPGISGRWEILLVPTVPAPSTQAQGLFPEPTENSLSLCCSPGGLLGGSPAGTQSQVTQGPVPRAAAPRAGAGHVSRLLLEKYCCDLEQAAVGGEGRACGLPGLRKARGRLLGTCSFIVVTLRQWLFKREIDSAPGEAGRGRFLLRPLHRPQDTPELSAFAPIKSYVLVCHRLVGLTYTNSLAFRARWFGGPIPPVGVLRVGTVDEGPKPFAPQGKAGEWGCLPHCAGGGVYGESVPQSFLPDLMRVLSPLPDR